MKLNAFLGITVLAAFLALGCSQNKEKMASDVDSSGNMAGDGIGNSQPAPAYERAEKELTADEIKVVLDEADVERKKAADLGHEWRDTAGMIKDSKAALEKGDLKTAQDLAERARHQGRMAVWQAGESKQTWMIAVPQ